MDVSGEAVDAHKFDFDELVRLGHLCQRDAQVIHAAICRHTGVTDPAAIVEMWNVESPAAPWDCPLNQFKGPYVIALTGIFCEFLKDKTAEAKRARERKSP